MNNNTKINSTQSYNKKYYMSNKSEILKKGSEYIDCSLCSCSVQKSHLSRHIKSKKCSYMQKGKELDKLKAIINECLFV